MVSTFDDEFNRGDHLRHLCKARSVMSQKVRTDEGVELRETGPRSESNHGVGVYHWY